MKNSDASEPAHRRAFTLIELLLVMVILVILATIVTTRWAGQAKNAKMTKARTDISNLQTALDAFQINCGRLPSNDEGLAALLTNPGLPNWSGPYIRILASDPWGTPYVYHAPGEHFPDSFDLYSIGPDQQEGSEDDIGNWQG